MLVLTRKAGESILIGHDIRVRVVSFSGTHARIAIEAPDDITILREEVYERIAQSNREAAAMNSDEKRGAGFGSRDTSREKE